MFYILKSLKDRKLYTGYTKNLKQRLEQHQLGKAYHTKNRRPLKLIYYEACLNRGDARRRERYLKSGIGKRFIKQRLKFYLYSKK
jgi:putative endonuclease